ncbi:hypothetical protein RRG08_003292 [Elysia crispata]|uniref:Uncharacterized protein n=1 Tax=Elysia crispata TaxID=231223 RepID=A0AAE1D0F4_9GAST|nr:hypothetical protein RRG08_003292 [Elysia crispata]
MSAARVIHLRDQNLRAAEPTALQGRGRLPVFIAAAMQPRSTNVLGFGLEPRDSSDPQCEKAILAPQALADWRFLKGVMPHISLPTSKQLEIAGRRLKQICGDLPPFSS